MASFSATEIAEILRYEGIGVLAELKPARRGGMKSLLELGRNKRHFFISLYVPSLEVVIVDLYKVGLSDADITQIAYVFKALAPDAKIKKDETIGSWLGKY